MKKMLLVVLFCQLASNVFIQTALASEVSIKNFREIYESLKVSTNLEPDAAAQSYQTYLKVFEILPTSGKVGEYGPSMQFAWVRLASEFCRERILKDAATSPASRWLHKKIDFSKSAGLQSDLSFLFGEYADVFWQRAQTPDEESSLTQFWKNTVTELGNTPESTIQALTAVCAVMGTTSDSILIR